MIEKQIWGENFRAFGVALIMLGLAVIVGTSGYMYFNENFTFIDALYMTIITITTVGFSEVHPLTVESKIFTMFLILVSFGIFGYLASMITRYILDGVFRRNLKDYRVIKKVHNLKNHVIICGFGRNGRQACEELIKNDVQVVIIDRREDKIELIRQNEKLLYVKGDATYEEILEEANITNAKALISAMPNDADNVYVTLTAREISPNLKIISRSSHFQSEKKLKRAGADNVIMPDRIGGQHMAKLVLQPDILEFLDQILLQKDHEVKLEEISCLDLRDKFLAKSIKELNIRDKSGANIIGLKNSQGTYIYNPSPDIALFSDVHIFVFGTPVQIKKLKKYLLSN